MRIAAAAAIERALAQLARRMRARALAQSQTDSGSARNSPSIASSIISEIASARRRVRKLVEARDEARVRLLVAAEQALDAGARRRQLHAQAHRIGRGERDALEQVGMALGEAALRGERAGAGQQEPDARLGGPVRRAGGAGRR